MEDSKEVNLKREVCKGCGEFTEVTTSEQLCMDCVIDGVPKRCPECKRLLRRYMFIEETCARCYLK